MRVGWECKWGWRPVCKCGPSLNTTTTQHYLLLLGLFARINEVQPSLLTNDNVMIWAFMIKSSEVMTLYTFDVLGWALPPVHSGEPRFCHASVLLRNWEVNFTGFNSDPQRQQTTHPRNFVFTLLACLNYKLSFVQLKSLRPRKSLVDEFKDCFLLFRWDIRLHRL